MNREVTIKQDIENALKTFDEQPLRESSTTLLNTLGYYSKRIGREDIDDERFQRLKESAKVIVNADVKLCLDDWQSFAQIMQVANDEIKQQFKPDQISLFGNSEINDLLRTSYMFDAMHLNDKNYSRTQLANITRHVSKQILQSFMLIFRYGDVISLAIINRRHHRRDKTKQVLEKVTLIKDINLRKPNRAHIDILSELHLRRLIENEGVRNFDALHDKWVDILNTEPLNRKFYSELFTWYQWAVEECKFPDGDNDMQVIRMITRLLFIWFLKEKDLVPEDIFEIEAVEHLLCNFSMDSSDYYQAVLQNLFFATLNTPITERKFSTRDSRNHRDASKFRYEELLQDSNSFLEHLKQVPFVNGGLFDCLDPFEAKHDNGKRIDCFTDNKNDRQTLQVPAEIFFNETEGIYFLFSKYKFTVEENTPVEQEVALDPELLGQVFENLLGSYNPETRSTARRATGSYYTPRQIVDYMVDEALIAYFLQKVKPFDDDLTFFIERLRLDLLSYEHQGKEGKYANHLIHEDEIDPLIDAIDKLRIIDPAVGTGAFPMGILNKIVLILRKLDPQNERWKQRQLTQADNIEDPESKKKAMDAIKEVFSEENRYNNYGRKLYLIQNCIYGVDIQPIAITIAKLRFFISLIIEQLTNDNENENYGIHPLPNLETKFVAANTLVGLKELKKSEFQQILGDADINEIRQDIAKFRSKHFNANTRQTKKYYRDQEKELRKKLSDTLASKHKEWCNQQEKKIEELVVQLPQNQTRLQLRERLTKEYKSNKTKLEAGLAEANLIAKWDAYDQNDQAEFFDAEWMFGIKDGFDITISNPPYIRQEMIRTIKPTLQAYYGDFFTSMADISVYFYKRAAELLRNNGILIYICTNKFMRNGYGRNLRNFLNSDMSLLKILDFGSVSIFEAGVNTCIVLVEKSKPILDHKLQAAIIRGKSNNFNVTDVFKKHAFLIKHSNLSSDGWTLASPSIIQLLNKLNMTEVTLKDSIEEDLYFGIKTGYDKAFLIDSGKYKSFVADSPIYLELLKPLLRGRTLRKWQSELPDTYLIVIESSKNRKWPWSNAQNTTEAERIFAEAYPAIYQHLVKYKKQLIAREDQGDYYWELRSCAYYDAFDKPKIIYPGTAKYFYGCYDYKQVYGLASTWIIPTDDYSILAILNSRVFDWYGRFTFQSLDDPWVGGRLNFKKIDMANVPIAKRTPKQKTELTALVKEILDDTKSDKVSILEKKINEIVYHIYGLSKREIRLIEQTYRDAEMEV